MAQEGCDNKIGFLLCIPTEQNLRSILLLPVSSRLIIVTGPAAKVKHLLDRLVISMSGLSNWIHDILLPVQWEPVALLATGPSRCCTRHEARTSSSVAEPNAFDQPLIPVMGEDWFRKVASWQGIHPSSVFAASPSYEISEHRDVEQDGIRFATASENFDNYATFQTSRQTYRVLHKTQKIIRAISFTSLE